MWSCDRLVDVTLSSSTWPQTMESVGMGSSLQCEAGVQFEGSSTLILKLSNRKLCQFYATGMGSGLQCEAGVQFEALPQTMSVLCDWHGLWPSMRGWGTV
jgi:hypothetical protein